MSLRVNHASLVLLLLFGVNACGDDIDDAGSPIQGKWRLDLANRCAYVALVSRTLE
jgi:hypothetical protein